MTDNNKNIVVAFGRSAGITKGHQENFEHVLGLAKQLNGSAHIHLSKSTDHKKNPIPYVDKVDLVKKMMPHVAHAIEDQAHVKTMIDVLKHHSNPDATLHVVAGKDRHDEIKALANKYNGSEFHYKNIQMHSSGERKEGISGTHLRELANNGNYDEFAKHAPTTAKPKEIKRMFDLVRSGSIAPPKKPRKGKLVEEFLKEASAVTNTKKIPKNKVIINPDYGTYQIKTHKDSEVDQNKSQMNVNSGNVNNTAAANTTQASSASTIGGQA